MLHYVIMGRAIAPFGLRIPPDLNQWLEEQAKINGRSKNAEIVARLKESYEQQMKWQTEILERLVRIEEAVEQLKEAACCKQSS